MNRERAFFLELVRLDSRADAMAPSRCTQAVKVRLAASALPRETSAALTWTRAANKHKLTLPKRTDDEITERDRAFFKVDSLLRPLLASCFFTKSCKMPSD